MSRAAKFDAHLCQLAACQPNGKFNHELKIGIDKALECPEVLNCVRYAHRTNRQFAKLTAEIVEFICATVGSDQSEQSAQSDISSSCFLQTYMSRFAVYADVAQDEEGRATAVAAKFVCTNPEVLLLSRFVLSRNPALISVVRIILATTVKTFNSHKHYIVPISE